VAEITDSPSSSQVLPLSEAELAVAEGAFAADPGSPRPVWSARFRAAREAVARAEGIPLTEAYRAVTVTGATAAVITVAARGRGYRVEHRDISTPEELRARRYAVAWTWGPEAS
jgi:hypothetical protein